MREQESDTDGPLDRLSENALSVYKAVLDKRSRKIYRRIETQTKRHYEIMRKSRVKRFVFDIFSAVVSPRSIESKKYLFVGLRYKELLVGLPREELLIIASSTSEMAYALAKRIDFIPSRNITYYFQEAYFDGAQDGFKKELRTLCDLFRSRRNICYLILTSDTKPVDIVFASLASQFGDRFRVLCIQHGIFPDTEPDLYVAEGERASFNILYAESQRQIAAKYIKNSEFLVMGPPWTLPHVKQQGNREVVLVGAGGGDSDDGYYNHTIDVFHELSKQLKDKRVAHVYRPHSTEIASKLRSRFETIDRRAKEELLSGPPKLFVGFSSTLMYEAYISGHTVYAIKPDRTSLGLSFSLNHSFAVDGLFSSAQIPALCSVITEATVVKKMARRSDFMAPLPERFKNTISKIEQSIAARNDMACS